MRTTLKSIIALFCFISFSNFLVIADDSEKKDIVISIGQGTQIPRTPNDLSGYYSAGVLYLQFSEEYAYVEIEVTNLTTGEVWKEEVINPASTEIMQIGDTSGDYQITVTTSSGDTLYGYFTL